MILIKNAKLPCEDKRIRTLDLLYDENGGKIVEISPKLENKDGKTVDARGGYILPAFTDMYAIANAPENDESMSLCALWGGYSNVLLVQGEISAKNNCKFHTPKELNALILGSDHKLNAKELREFMKKCAEEGKLLIASPKKDELYQNSCITEGRTASLLKLPCEPPSVEARSVYEYLILAKESGCKLHIRGISTEDSVELIRNAKKQGVTVTSSTSPSYFSLTDEDAVFIGTNSKVYPPLRSTNNRAAIIEGIKDNTIDCIDSDHTPVSSQDKKGGFLDSEYGAIGLQTVFSAACTYLLMPGHIDIFRLCELLSYNPAKILGLDTAKYINEGCHAFVLASLTEEYILTKTNLLTEAKNCPYIGMSLCGVIKNAFI